MINQLDEIHERIDDKIDEWHDMDDDSSSLHEFLGWTKKEFELYVEKNIIPECEFDED